MIDEEADSEEYQLEALQVREPIVHEDPPVDRMIFEQMARQNQAQEFA